MLDFNQETRLLVTELLVRLKQEIPALAVVLPYPHSYRFCEKGNLAPVLCLAVPKGFEWKIWLCFQQIKAKLLSLCAASRVVICCEGKFFIPNKTLDGGEMSMEASMNTVFQRLLHSQKSGGLVDYATNELIWATPQIHETAGRSLLDVLTSARNMSSTWDAAEEERRDRDLRERQTLIDYVYCAYNWEKVAAHLWVQQTSPTWQKVKRSFRAQSMSMIEIGGRWFRLTEGVEIAS